MPQEQPIPRLAIDLKAGAAQLRDAVKAEYADLALADPLGIEAATVLALTPPIAAAIARLSKQIDPRPKRPKRSRRK